MGYKSFLVRPYARHIARQIARWSAAPELAQAAVLQQLLRQARDTAFGREHGFAEIRNYEDFKRQVPVREYEELKPYVNRIIAGERDVLWPGRPRYFAKTSGTTSGVKYIPLTKDSIPNHFGTARNALFNYYAKTGKGGFLDGKMIFLSGSPELEEVGGIPTGRLSGIVNHMVPGWLKRDQLPSYETNCIDAWEEKLDAIVGETMHQDMRLISGIPPWVQMYYERLLARSGKSTVRDLFPNYSIFVYGGVNFEPYRAALEHLVGGRIDSLETYPASEGFIAFQDDPNERSLLLNVDSGIFFEFIPTDRFFEEHPPRYRLEEVELGVNYALIMHTNAGLWGYSIGDTVQFTSLRPYRLLVTGRIKHFISAFGEHVIGKEVEEAMLEACAQHSVRAVEFTVAPQVKPPEGGLPYHEWLIEFEAMPESMEQFARDLDAAMTRQNIYYQDLIGGKVLQPLKIRSLPRDAFRAHMKRAGKLGGQNKVPRLSNDRNLADAILSGGE